MKRQNVKVKKTTFFVKYLISAAINIMSITQESVLLHPERK